MRPPDRTGNGVRAWKLVATQPPRNVDHTATLGAWLINCTWAHPAWQWWFMGLVHLRPIQGQSKPAFRRYPEAEFEIVVWSIDPERCPAPDPDQYGDGYPMLLPIDHEHQFHGVSDADAVRIADLFVRAIADGILSPDQDFRSVWRHHLDATVAHYRAGKHVVH